MCIRDSYLPMGYLVDRFHPLRIYLAGALLVIFVNPFGFFFVHGYGTFMAMGILLAVVYTVQNSSLLPLCVKLYPKEQFGQFCSAAVSYTHLANNFCWSENGSDHGVPMTPFERLIIC